MSYIYKITNSINNQVYIGRTDYSLSQRFQQHLKDSTRERNSDRPLYKAMNEFGLKNFTISLVEETDSPDERERYWINEYDSYKNGYNATPGGQGRTIYNHEEIIQLYLKEKSAGAVASRIGCCVETVYDILKAHNVKAYSSSEMYKKRVQMLSLTGDLIREFSSMLEAAHYMIDNKLTGCKLTTMRTHISEVCQGKRQTANGFKWKLVE